MSRRKNQLVYAVLDDPEDPSKGAYLVEIIATTGDSQANRERAKFELEQRFVEELPPFDRYPFAFPNGLSVEQNLIYISEEFIVARKSNSVDSLSIDLEGIDPEKKADIEAIINGAAEIIAKARLIQALSTARTAALPYAELLRAMFDETKSQYLTPEQCAMVEDKAFAKTIKDLAEAKAEMAKFNLTATGNWQLILDCIIADEGQEEEVTNSDRPKAQVTNGKAVEAAAK